VKRVLILTAGFGEGHNTAARNMKSALEKERPGEMDIRIVDVYAQTNPRLNWVMKKGYYIAITHVTGLWKAVFQLFNRPGVLEGSLPLIAGMRKALAKQIHEFDPSLIISTYPVYSFLAAQIRDNGNAFTSPFVMMVTDSTEINSVWYRCASDYFIVVDEPTSERLVEGGAQADRIRVLGFPVDPRFADLEPLPEDTPPPWRILFMPTGKRRQAIETLQFLLSHAHVNVTVLTGKNDALKESLTPFTQTHPGRCTLVGWTDQIPQLMTTHHLFLGKAGGAVTQEALAAGCPLMIQHVVPGQEEGNIAYILHEQIGALANTPELLRIQFEEAFGGEARGWRRWKRNILKLRRAGASSDIARFLLQCGSS